MKKNSVLATTIILAALTGCTNNGEATSPETVNSSTSASSSSSSQWKTTVTAGEAEGDVISPENQITLERIAQENSVDPELVQSQEISTLLENILSQAVQAQGNSPVGTVNFDDDIFDAVTTDQVEETISTPISINEEDPNSYSFSDTPAGNISKAIAFPSIDGGGYIVAPSVVFDSIDSQSQVVTPISITPINPGEEFYEEGETRVTYTVSIFTNVEGKLDGEDSKFSSSQSQSFIMQAEEENWIIVDAI